MPASKQVSYTYTTTVKLLALSYNGAAVLRSAVLETLNRLNTQGIAQMKVTRKRVQQLRSSAWASCWGFVVLDGSGFRALDSGFRV